MSDPVGRTISHNEIVLLKLRVLLCVRVLYVFLTGGASSHSLNEVETQKKSWWKAGDTWLNFMTALIKFHWLFSHWTGQCASQLYSLPVFVQASCPVVFRLFDCFCINLWTLHISPSNWFTKAMLLLCPSPPSRENVSPNISIMAKRCYLKLYAMERL